MVLLLITVAGISLETLKNSNDSLKTVYEDRALSLIYLARMNDMYLFKILDPFIEVESGKISLEEALKNFEEGEREFKRQWKSYVNTKAVPEEKILIEELDPFIEDVSQSLVFVRDKLKQRDREGAFQYLKENVDPMMDIVFRQAAKLKDIQLEVTKSEYEEVLGLYRSQKIELAIGIFIGIILMVGISFSLIRNITKSLKYVSDELEEIAKGEADLDKRIPVNSHDEIGRLIKNFNKLMDRLAMLVSKVLYSDRQVNLVSNTISGVWEHLESSVDHTGALTDNIVATAKDISKTSQGLVKTMDNLSKISRDTAILAESGQKSIQRLETAMEQVEKVSKKIHEQLKVISDKAANITVVVTTITKVADQTNLLSLNAAIEAEKAGEYGVGFSVVSKEIRRLADQTALATLDIEKIVDEMKKAVLSGVSDMKVFSQELRQDAMEIRGIGAQMTMITGGIQELTPKFKEVYNTVQEQASGASQITTFMFQLSEAAKESNESLRNSLKVMGDLQIAVEELHKQVSLFKLKRDIK